MEKDTEGVALAAEVEIRSIAQRGRGQDLSGRRTETTGEAGDPPWSEGAAVREGGRGVLTCRLLRAGTGEGSAVTRGEKDGLPGDLTPAMPVERLNLKLHPSKKSS